MYRDHGAIFVGKPVLCLFPWCYLKILGRTLSLVHIIQFMTLPLCQTFLRHISINNVNINMYTLGQLFNNSKHCFLSKNPELYLYKYFYFRFVKYLHVTSHKFPNLVQSKIRLSNNMNKFCKKIPYQCFYERFGIRIVYYQTFMHLPLIYIQYKCNSLALRYICVNSSSIIENI